MAKLFSISQSLVHETVDEKSTKCGIDLTYGREGNKVKDGSFQIVSDKTPVTCSRCK